MEFSMAGTISLKGLIEEDLMESKSIVDSINEDMGEIVNLIDLNEKLDRENDKIRANVRRHLLAAIRGYKMARYEEADNHVHAALQMLDEQAILDLKDDIPRGEAKLKIAVLQTKLTNNSESIRRSLGKLNPQ